jgi:hypothetical protein
VRVEFSIISRAPLELSSYLARNQFVWNRESSIQLLAGDQWISLEIRGNLEIAGNHPLAVYQSSSEALLGAPKKVLHITHPALHLLSVLFCNMLVH